MYQNIDSIPFAALAGEYAEHVHALALTEHWGHLLTPDCIYGLCRYGDDDAGKAFGVLQEHPAYLAQWYREDGPPFGAKVEDDVPAMQIKACARFLTAMVPVMTLDGAVTAQNVGVAAYRQGQRNPAYLERFTLSLSRVRSAKV